MPTHKMSVVNGVRYRPEHVPEESKATRPSTEKSTSDAQHKARRPARSARSGDNPDDE